MNCMGKILILVGISLVIAGIFFTLGGKIPWIGRLQGDIAIQRKNFSFYFPITSCILISAVLSIILFLFFRK